MVQRMSLVSERETVLSCAMRSPPSSAQCLIWMLPLVFWGSRLLGQTVFINELHYDNASVDTEEGIEIAGPAGVNLADYQLVFYNGTTTPAAATVVTTKTLSGTLSDLGAGYGVKWFGLPPNGIQNGSNDGVALYRISTAQVVQFLSWEGSLSTSTGVATGLTSVDIGVAESDATPTTHSLQLQGIGNTYAQFTWVAAASSTHDAANHNQTFSGVVRTTFLTVNPASVDEGIGTAEATLTLSPPPASSQTFTLTSSDLTEATIPASIAVGISGVATFPVSALIDGITDGDQALTFTAVDQGGLYPNATANFTVRDADAPTFAPGSTLRVACFNVAFGVGAPGSGEFLAVKDQLQRIRPDVIAFEEVDAANNFADMKSLLTELGFPTTNQYFATKGDAFASFASGAVGSNTNQCVCLASRFPITQAVQIDRGVAGRTEMTRYPLFVAVDVPGIPAADDPAFVVVHLKANSGTNGPTDVDRFRRIVEMYRVSQFLQSNGWNGASKNLFMLGDFNENDFVAQPVSIFTGINTAAPFPDGSSLPGSYVLGADIAGANGITLPYQHFPHTQMAAVNLAAPETLQAEGTNPATFNTADVGRLDYIFARQSFTSAGLYLSEVYNSRLEVAFDGLPKTGNQLPAGNLSFLASDHFAVFADVPLASLPKLTLTAPVAWINEAQTAVVNLTLSLSVAPGAGQPVTVALSEYRPGRIHFPVSTVTFNGSQTTGVIPVEILHPPAVDAHRTITISATAPGWFPGKATFEIRNQEAGGAVIISQYLEPVSSSSARAIEILNQSGAELDFSVTPLVIRRFTNGDSLGVNEAQVTQGALPAGQVLVIGDGPAGEALLSNQLIQGQASVTPTSAPTGTPFFDAVGKLKFWKDTFTYNGNDALEVLMNFTRMDVFGTIGQDPGTAWTGGSVRTMNQNLSLKSTVGTGTHGFTDPSTRFFTVSTSDATTGLGVPPTINDPYLAWASTLSGLNKSPEADPDGDGLLNLLEYALNTDPLTTNAAPLQIQRGAGGTFVIAQVRIPAVDESLSYALQQSTDLSIWTIESAVPTVTNLGNGMQSLAFPVTLAPARRSFRLLVKRG